MKKIIFKFLFLHFFLCFAFVALGKDVFTLAQCKNSISSNIVMGRSYSSNGSISLSNMNNSVIGLCISGKVVKNDKDFFVRILLKDKTGNKYLVMESYDEINDSSSFKFDNFCEETALLPIITPDSLMIFVYHAEFQLDKITYTSNDDKFVFNPTNYQSLRKDLKKEQVKIKTEKINTYNKKNKKLWFAGVTDMSMTDFSTRMRQLGLSDSQNTGGLEYYIGGVFEMGSPIFRGPPNYSPYVKNFDWRDRHGRNWMTSVKNQGGSNYCSAFSSVAVLESLVKLYFNTDSDLDLSEQEAARCNAWQAPSVYYTGMEMHYPIDYIVENGLCDESSYPFFDANTPDCIRDQVVPIYTAQPGGLRNYINDWDSIKYEIINHGPLISGYYMCHSNDTIPYFAHAMALVGYGQIQVGDKYSVNNNGIFYETDSIDFHDERIGQTYWIFKDSYYGQHEWEHDGYMYLIFNNHNMMIPPCTFELPIMLWGLNNYNIICEDRDGDGYYFWGLGPKPSSCPYWVPNNPDGDDSDPQKGALNNYGYADRIGQLLSTYTILNTTNYNDDRGLSSNIVVSNGGVMNITSEVVMANCKIFVMSGGTLIIDGGRLLHADIELEPSSSLIIKNNGLVHMKPGVTFIAPIGAYVTVESGEIS